MVQHIFLSQPIYYITTGAVKYKKKLLLIYAIHSDDAGSGLGLAAILDEDNIDSSILWGVNPHSIRQSFVLKELRVTPSQYREFEMMRVNKLAVGKNAVTKR